jgi:hypothetical protein
MKVVYIHENMMMQGFSYQNTFQLLNMMRNDESIGVNIINENSIFNRKALLIGRN